jgi:hypothetical protein
MPELMGVPRAIDLPCLNIVLFIQKRKTPTASKTKHKTKNIMQKIIHKIFGCWTVFSGVIRGVVSTI